MYNEEDEYIRGLYVALSILEHSKDKFKASESIRNAITQHLEISKGF